MEQIYQFVVSVHVALERDSGHYTYVSDAHCTLPGSTMFYAVMTFRTN